MTRVDQILEDVHDYCQKLLTKLGISVTFGSDGYDTLVVDVCQPEIGVRCQAALYFCGYSDLQVAAWKRRSVIRLGYQVERLSRLAVDRCRGQGKD